MGPLVTFALLLKMEEYFKANMRESYRQIKYTTAGSSHLSTDSGSQIPHKKVSIVRESTQIPPYKQLARQHKVMEPPTSIWWFGLVWWCTHPGDEVKGALIGPVGIAEVGIGLLRAGIKHKRASQILWHVQVKQS